MSRPKRPIDLLTTDGRNRFYQSTEWRALRRIVLTERPFCEECLKLGIHTVAGDVDHIVDIKDNPSKFFDRGNLQSLCRSCHSKKTYKASLAGVWRRQNTFVTVNKRWKV